jgi:hypothetical protein
VRATRTGDHRREGTPQSAPFGLDPRGHVSLSPLALPETLGVVGDPGVQRLAPPYQRAQLARLRDAHGRKVGAARIWPPEPEFSARRAELPLLTLNCSEDTAPDTRGIIRSTAMPT